MGPKQPSSTVLNREDEALLVAFRKHTLLPLDACLYALQATLPYLPRSVLQRCLQRHGIGRLPDSDPSAPQRAPIRLPDGLQFRQTTQNPERTYPG
jgi:hypothetical protein